VVNSSKSIVGPAKNKAAAPSFNLRTPSTKREKSICSNYDALSSQNADDQLGREPVSRNVVKLKSPGYRTVKVESSHAKQKTKTPISNMHSALR
jgi:hypothetical protein